MPATLSDANRKAARARAKKDFGVAKGDLYIVADDGRWGPIACVAHRLHPDRVIQRLARDANGREERWEEPDLHQTGQEPPVDGPEAAYEPPDDSYPGYQTDCPLCADQVYDTMDHIDAYRRDQARAG